MPEIPIKFFIKNVELVINTKSSLLKQSPTCVNMLVQSPCREMLDNVIYFSWNRILILILSNL